MEKTLQLVPEPGHDNARDNGDNGDNDVTQEGDATQPSYDTDGAVFEGDEIAGQIPFVAPAKRRGGKRGTRGPRGLRGSDHSAGGRWARLVREDLGAVTAEYAIIIMAAVAFAGLLVAILRSSEIRAMLMQLVEDALASAG